MAQDPPAQDLMNYEAMAQEALRGVIQAALRRAARPEGLPGDHHLYISFKTRAAGVSLPTDIAAKYPDEMTIVLQNQFWDLSPGETFFMVTLRFGGQPKQLSIPYAAITRFFDPSVQFMLQFESSAPILTEVNSLPAPTAQITQLAPAEADTPKVVSLDTFRKK